MTIGIWQILIIAYILFVALGPRRVVGWVRWTQDTSARLQGRPPPKRRRLGFLAALEMMEYSTQIGWACLALGFGVLVLDGVLLHWGPPLIALSMLLLFLAPWFL